jgi:uncharacterized protein YfkK (UPF0435 family)
MRVSEFMNQAPRRGAKGSVRKSASYRAARRNDAKKVYQMVKHKRARSR